MEGIRPAMERALSALSLKEPSRTVVSCITGEPYAARPG